MEDWLVVSNTWIIFPNSWDDFLQSDFHSIIFQGALTTNQTIFPEKNMYNVWLMVPFLIACYQRVGQRPGITWV